jgi:leucyl aminopeptidase
VTDIAVGDTDGTPSSGSLQAGRARFRYMGSAYYCSVGAFTDHDDLVFAVQP